MNSPRSNEVGLLQKVIGAAYILAFLAAIAFSSQPYSRDLKLRYLAVLVVLIAALIVSRFRVAILASGFAVLAVRCLVGLFGSSQHTLAFLLGSAASACLAWFLLKASIKRYG